MIYLFLFSLQSRAKKIFVLFIVILAFIGSAFLSLYGNFLLGNDILISLSADKENIFFSGNPEQKVVFTTSVSINPFCVAKCQYSFIDLGTGDVIDAKELSITPLVPTSLEYSFNSEGHVSGQELERFEIRCESQKTRLCYTRKEESRRTVLITVNYDLSEEQKIKNEISKQEIISMEKLFYNLTKSLDNADFKVEKLDVFVVTEGFIPEYSYLSSTLFELNGSFDYLKHEWGAQNYSAFEKKWPILKEKVNNLSEEEGKFIFLVDSNISLYNELIQELNQSKNTLTQMVLENFSDDSCLKLNKSINEFNKITEEFSKRTNISYKQLIVKNISSEIRTMYESVERGNDSFCMPSAISEISFPEINLTFTNESPPEFYIEEPSPICCLYGKCEACCNESCSNKNYPVLFLHGHSFNKEISADYSFDAFEIIKKNLEEEGYIDAGTITIKELEEQKGLWGKVNAPIEVTGSYFFDFSKSETGESVIIPSKTESIDTYAIRLNEIIESVKYKTGKEKIIIIAHSMGGLVTRRYAQIFGEEDIEKIIFISVPNHGIEENIENYCAFIGSEIECKEMGKNSFLISKLNGVGNMSLPVYNLIGKGCVMDEESGDGIATESSQYLGWAINYYTEGNCSELEFFHNQILDSTKYPQAYSLIKEMLIEK
jgi:pimeloyl-ACP methyl ester carboxylesterase